MKKLLLALLLLNSTAFAVEHEGVSPIGTAGLTMARQAAIADALENAALFNGATVNSQSFKQGAKWGEATQVKGTPQGDYRVIREWENSGLLHVVIDVQPPAPPVVEAATAKSMNGDQAGQCASGNYRRKVLISHFWLQRPAQTSDLDRFPEGLQTEMVRQMYNSGQFIAQRAAGEAAFDVLPQFADPQLQPDRVRELARRYAVQFVVGGIVRDTSFSGERYTVGWGNDVRAGEQKRVSNLPVLNFMQFGVKSTPAARRFDMDVFIFDGVSGALVNRHQISGKASGSVVQETSNGLGSPAFLETDYGRLIDQKLNETVALLTQDLSCIPFSARITRVDKNMVYFDAGGTSKVAPGDTLQVYRILPGGLPVDAASFEPGMRLGVPEQKVGRLTVTQVQPLFAMGVVTGVKVESGDYVRWIGQERKNE